MAITRPTADQLSFRSSVNGVQNLDDYREAAERGGRRLGDLLSDLFDNTGQFANDAFQFRVNSVTRQLQVRVGTFTDPEDSWADLAGIFRPQGLYINNAPYSTMDVVGDGTDLWLVTSDIAINEIANLADFQSSSKTFKILIGDAQGAAASYVTQAEDARDLANTYQGQALAYRNEAQSYASGSPADGSSSALILRNEAQNARDGILNNSAFNAVANDLNLGASSNIVQIQPYLDELDTLINGQITGSNPVRYNIDDVNSVAANMQNITTVVGLDARMADIVAFEPQITAVGNDLVGNNYVTAVAGVSQEIVTIATDLDLGASSVIRQFASGLSTTIDDLTINGVARGSVFYDNLNPGVFDLEESNNFVFDYAEWPSHNGVIEFKNAHNCREMQPFTIAIKQSAAYNPSSGTPASLTFVGFGGAGYNFKYPNGVAPTLTTANNNTDIITIGGYVLSPDPVNQTAAIIIGHMVNV